MNAARAQLYFHTLRCLRPAQVLGRVWRVVNQPSVDDSPAPELRRAGTWTAPARREASWLSPTRRSYLSREREVPDASDWNSDQASKLWLYNLHYFDDLNAAEWEDRQAWHLNEIARWMAQNPAGDGNGWEAYPLSLRIVNWIKWALAGNATTAVMRHSLAVQTRYLRASLEHHLLGNHLFANAKALIFAGCFFEGNEAKGWLSKGLELLNRELAEQVLADGGHFERSPMYHSIILEDGLDLLNLLAAYREALPGSLDTQRESWLPTVQAMRRWLQLMCHPDGEIALFNDSAFGIAPKPAELQAYARRLGLGPCALPSEGVHWLEESGYLRLQQGEACAWLDVGDIGPSYLPGHAHADSLGFEFSLGNERVLVDSGTSLYENGDERLRQRGTAAHNTIVVDDADSSEVWSSFRVARRARPRNLVVQEQAGLLRVSCGHDGYLRLPGRVFHTRTWRMEAGRLSIHDQLDGRFDQATANWHLHPEIAHPDAGCLSTPSGDALRYETSQGPPRVEPSSWHPRFGQSLPSTRLCQLLTAPELRTTLTW